MMLTLIAETESVERQHRNALQNLMKQTEGTVRIASAYVTDTRLLSGIKGRYVRLLTYISRMDIIVAVSYTHLLGFESQHRVDGSFLHGPPICETLSQLLACDR